MKTPTREVRDLVERLTCEVHDLHERSLSSPPLDSRWNEPPKVISDNPARRAVARSSWFRAVGSLAHWCVSLPAYKEG